MNFVSVLIPAFTFSDSYTKNSNKVVQEFFNLTDDSNLEYYELIKINDFSQISNHQIAIKLKNSDLSLTMFERLMEENNQQKVYLQKCKESIKTLTLELDSFQNCQKNELEQQKNLQNANEEIKKLKLLLSQQLQNAEKMRIDTQNTVDTLKTEFDLLELGNVHQEYQHESNKNNYLFDCGPNSNAQNYQKQSQQQQSQQQQQKQQQTLATTEISGLQNKKIIKKSKKQQDLIQTKEQNKS